MFCSLRITIGKLMDPKFSLGPDLIMSRQRSSNVNDVSVDDSEDNHHRKSSKKAFSRANAGESSFPPMSRESLQRQ